MHEIWFTRILNNYLAGAGNFLLGLVGIHGGARPWTNYVAMELLVVLIIVVVFAALKRTLSVGRPGSFQLAMETLFEFMHSETADQLGHQGERYLPFFGTLFIFILIGNLIGIIPGFESPTMYPAVPVGCAIATFLYYNMVGVQTQGPVKYAVHFAGPIPWLAPLMLPIEIISHLARPLSLSLRLYANMYAGEQVTQVFLGLTYFVFPALFMGLHVFVGLLQAYIFMLLAIMYVAGSAVTEH